MTTERKDSGVKWVGTIPANWEINKIKYISTLKGRIGWQGLTSEEYTNEGAYLITGTDFEKGSINWDTCVHVPMRRWEEARDIQIENGDLLITKDGTIGKVAIVKNMPGKTSLNSGVLRIMPIEGYSRRFLYWVIQSEEFWNWFNYKNAGNSTIIHLYQEILLSLFMHFRIMRSRKASPIILICTVPSLTVSFRIWSSRLRHCRNIKNPSSQRR